MPVPDRWSVKVSPLALDAVARVASGGVGDPQAAPVASVWRSVTQRTVAQADGPRSFFEDLDRELVRSELRALVFGRGGEASFSAADDGPAENVRAAAFLALHAFENRASRILHGARVARVDILLHGGGVLRWSVVDREAPWAVLIVADDGATSPAFVERLGGRLRRDLDASQRSALATDATDSARANGSLP